jgi:hypothetical protein
MIITDAGVLGSKRFVREVFEEIKRLLGSKRERQFVRVIEDAGVYSLNMSRPELNIQNAGQKKQKLVTD